MTLTHLKPALKRLFQNCVLVCFGILVSELSLQVVTYLLPSLNSVISIKQVNINHEPTSHPILIRKPNPTHPEHDNRGYRNFEALEKANIVALGDSQTYGFNAKRFEMWPFQLERQLRTPVYNISYPGWSMIQYLYLVDEALTLKPKQIVVAWYLGNDLVNAFSSVYEFNVFPDLKSGLGIQSEISKLESNKSVREITTKMGKRLSAFHHYQPAAPEPVHVRVRKYLSIESKVYGVIRTLKRSLLSHTVAEAAPIDITDSHAKHEWMPKYTHLSIETVFTPEPRLFAVDTDELRVNEGLKMTFRALKKIDKKTKQQGVGLTVLLIPTKESVFADVAKNKLVSNSYHKLIKAEAHLLSKIKKQLNTLNIAYVDALPSLREVLKQDINPYFKDTDGHPNYYGHKALASVVATHLDKTNVTPQK